jgi:hypothetical protein
MASSLPTSPNSSPSGSSATTKTIKKEAATPPAKTRSYDWVRSSELPTDIYQRQGIVLPPRSEHSAQTGERGQLVPQTEIDIKTALVEGYPVSFGFAVFGSIESDLAAGVLNMPALGDKCIGGYQSVLVGYDAVGRRFLAIDPFNDNRFEISFDYALNSELCGDFFTLV